MPSSTRSDDQTIFVATRFHSLARRPGGISREQAIEAAQADLGRLQPNFAKWLDQELDLLIKAIPADTSEVSGDDAWLEPAYRHCRAVRDVGATMGFDLVSFIANNLCEVIDIVRAGVECPIDAIDTQVKALMLAKVNAERSLHAREKPSPESGGTPPKRP